LEMYTKFVGVRKQLESVGYGERGLRDPMFRAFLIELQLVTDRQTERRTQGHSIYRASIASLGKNNIVNICDETAGRRQ